MITFLLRRFQLVISCLMCGLVLLNKLNKEGQHPCQMEWPMDCSYKVATIHVHEHTMFIEFLITILTLASYNHSVSSDHSHYE